MAQNDDGAITKAIDSIIQKISSLKCSDSTLSLTPDIQNAENACRKSVAVKIIDERIYRRQAIRDLISAAWHLSYAWSISSAGLHEQNIFHMIFEHEADKKRVMDLRPWSINGAHIVVRDSFPDTPVLQTDFSHSCFWVQAHGVPLKFATETNAKVIGEKVEIFLDSQLKAEGHIVWSRYLREDILKSPEHFVVMPLKSLPAPPSPPAPPSSPAIPPTVNINTAPNPLLCSKAVADQNTSPPTNLTGGPNLPQKTQVPTPTRQHAYPLVPAKQHAHTTVLCPRPCLPNSTATPHQNTPLNITTQLVNQNPVPKTQLVPIRKRKPIHLSPIQSPTSKMSKATLSLNPNIVDGSSSPKHDQVASPSNLSLNLASIAQTPPDIDPNLSPSPVGHIFQHNPVVVFPPEQLHIPRFCVGSSPSPHPPNRDLIRSHSSWKKRARATSVTIPARPSLHDLELVPNHGENPSNSLSNSFADSNSPVEAKQVPPQEP
ncbi:hypothetical protein TorRG33x02_307630 [Trema orientale]|uniref:Uncharacterized protein n=1 Tax=Trema orientale TaxID=63057 RepID=A0A2P5BVB2_TREOI|nr:hypothetical protein TorRG33x02_307630 [Trema orientale]